jgi:hypothetical protein
MQSVSTTAPMIVSHSKVLLALASFAQERARNRANEKERVKFLSEFLLSLYRGMLKCSDKRSKPFAMPMSWRSPSYT